MSDAVATQFSSYTRTRDELLKAVSEAADAYFHSDLERRTLTREAYIRALAHFNDFVLENKTHGS
jgi:hypothetical protein